MRAVALVNSSLVTKFSWSRSGAKRFGYNTGNTLIGAGLRAIVPDLEVVSGGQSLHLVSDPANFAAYLNSNFSRVLVVLQDHIQFRNYGNPWALSVSEMQRLVQTLTYIEKPICFVSVTSRTDSLHNMAHEDLTNFSQDLLKVFQRRESLVLTRGQDSANFLHKLGVENVHASLCPSAFVELPKPGRTVRSRRISTTGYLPIARDFNEFDAHLVQGDGIEGPYRHLARRKSGFHGASVLARRKLSTLSYGALDRALMSGRAYFPDSIVDWSDRVQQSSLVIGSRLHGMIVSLASGVPAVCTSGDVRTRETLKAFGLEPLKLHDAVSTSSLDSLHAYAAQSTETFRSAVEFHRPLFLRFLADFVKI